jgi:hypothetical protein
MTTHLLSILALLGAATSTAATVLIWVLLTEPTTVASALADGGLRTLAAAIAGVWQ